LPGEPARTESRRRSRRAAAIWDSQTSLEATVARMRSLILSSGNGMFIACLRAPVKTGKVL